MARTRTPLRTQVVRDIVREWNATHTGKITEADARAMLRGQCTVEQQRFADSIARAWGLDN